MSEQAKVAVVGATGYAGYELARLLLRHPNVSTPTFFLREGRANVRCLTELYPQLRGWGEAPCKPLSTEAVAGSGAEVVFLSTPHEASLELVPELAEGESGAAHRGFERGVPFSRSGDVRALVQIAGAGCGNAGRSGLRAAGTVRGGASQGAASWRIPAATRLR